MRTKYPLGKSLGPDGTYSSEASAQRQTLTYFIVTVFGFSFWFFMAIPFASHRESYWWLAMVYSHDFTEAFSFITRTYRPLAQAATWLGFMILNPSVFPTSVLRQALLQGFIYGMFVLAWWLIYTAAAERRLFALLAFVVGCVFFPGYIQLFHIYGIFYIGVILTLGVLLRFYATRTLERREAWLAIVATLLAIWHPFATALFVGFYFGFYVDTFRQRSRAQHVQASVILLVGILTIAALCGFVQRTDTVSAYTGLFGLLVSYRTNEVNLTASLVAFLLTQMVVFSMELSPKLKVATSLLASVISALFLVKSLPLLLLWLCAALIKLLYLRRWSLFFLTLTAAVLPFGGGIGTPIYALFAIILAVYVTPLGWSQAEKTLSFLKTRYVIGAITLATITLLMVRMEIKVPIVTRVARPLLAERERTYQLEHILAWLHNSDYCGSEVTFAENAGSPIDSIESAITRRNRPPAAVGDVEFFWKSVLQCQKGKHPENKAETAVVTFGGSALTNSRPVFQVPGRYAGEATVWVADVTKTSALAELSTINDPHNR